MDMSEDINLADMCLQLQEQVKTLRNERDELRGRQDFANALEQAVQTRSRLLPNQEFALLYFPSGKGTEKAWLAMMGNSSPAVVVACSGGELEAWGPTAKDAVQNMMDQLRKAENAMRDILKGGK